MPEASQTATMQPVKPSSLFLLESVAPAAGAILATVLFLGPMPAMIRARRAGTLGAINASLFPWIVVNCAAYLSLGVLRKDKNLVIANFPGFVFGLFYLFSCLILATKDNRFNVTERSEQLTLGLSSALAVVLVTSRWLSTEAANALIGNFAMVMSICMFAAPLSTVRQVLRERNSASINLGFLSGQMANCTMWTSYGAATNDPYVLVPNALGLLLGLGQFGLVGLLPRKAAVVMDDGTVPLPETMDTVIKPGPTLSTESGDAINSSLVIDALEDSESSRYQTATPPAPFLTPRGRVGTDADRPENNRTFSRYTTN